MSVPYFLQLPVETKSIHSPPKLLTRIKEIMNEDFPQLPAINVTKSLTPQKKKSKNKKPQFFQILPDDSQTLSESIAPPLISEKEEMKEADLPEHPAQKFKVTIKNPCGLPINSSKKTEDEHNSLQHPTDDSAKDTTSLIKPFTPKKKPKKWQPLPLDIPTTLDTNIIPGRQFYHRNQGPKLNSAQAPPKNANLTLKRKPPNDNSSPHTPTDISSSQISTNNQHTTNYPTIPISPSRKATRMDPVYPSKEMVQTNKKPHAAIIVNNRRHQRRGLIYKNAPRDRPYYAMIQCGLSPPGSSSSSSSNSGEIKSCNQPKNCSFGHEEDRYYDSPWHVQRFVLGFNVDLWESKVGLEGKLDLFKRREELMAIGDVINREGLKVGYRKLVEVEKSKRGLTPQTDDWCWAGRAYKAKTGSSSKDGKGNWEDQTGTSTSKEDKLDWVDQTLDDTSVSSQEDGDTDGEELIDENKMRFQEHLRAETVLYKFEQGLAEKVREEERKLQQNQAIFDMKLWEQQQEFEREMHAGWAEFDELCRYVRLEVEQQQRQDQEEQQRRYQEQQRQYEAQRHASRAYNKPIARPSSDSITTSTVTQMETVRYNKPIARPTTTPTSTTIQAVQPSFFVTSGLSEIPHDLYPQWIQPPRSHVQGTTCTGERWCFFKHFGPATLSGD
ncbi:uncharacterized protein H6S33_004419 [Morchella sextelata]|uniref:uncharacterized protein n=1 Tax=Morchella sextelata TaxID=1174677 RepID=UPI001D05BC71|nr:uncharacterized protein H6S33_004419 [Morchella sextelata]KAH0605962.1 hypothetical protein H6S33_004419 [Morchella sextelata]